MTTPTINSDGARRGWRTPTHPPYAKMIDAAIRFLAEEGGSTEEEISEYIRAHYDGLPWAHDRFLPYYLNRLTNLGLFVVVAPGRYLTAYSHNAPAALEPGSTGLGEPQLAPMSVSVGVPAVGPSPVESSPGSEGTLPGVSSSCSPASETGSTMSIPEPGCGGGQEAECSLPMFGSPGSQPDDGTQQDASSVRKRRGRQPKRVADKSQESMTAPARRPPKKATALNAIGEHGTNPITPLPVTENGSPSSHIYSSPLPPPAFVTVVGLDYVLALPNQGPVKSADIKEDPPSVDELKAASNGEAKNEAEVPARPSTATSDHPPNTEMIPTAFQNFPEDGGFTEDSKSECIVANYDRLVPLYLNVDPANTEDSSSTLPSTLHMPACNDNWPTPPGYMAGSEPGLCMANNGLLQDAAAAGPELNPGDAPGTSKSSPDSETGSTMSLAEPVVIDDFVLLQDAAAAGPELNPGDAPGTSKPSPDSETGSTMSLAEPVVIDTFVLLQDAAAAGPELNPGDAPGTSKPSPDSETGSTMSLAEPVVIDAFVQPLQQLFTFAVPESNGVKQQLGGEDPCPVRKRRGRPPKRKINDTDLAQDGREITNNAPPATAAPGDGGVGGSDPLVRRRRGRPRKRPLNEGDRNSGNAQHGSGWSIQAQAQLQAQVQVQAPVLADGECYEPMRSSEPAEPPSSAEVPPLEEWTTEKAFLLALLEGTNLELDASVRERLECVLTTPSVEATRSNDGETPPPPAGWGNELMAASGSFGVESMGRGVSGDTAAVPPSRGRGRPPKGHRRRGRPRKNQF